ncbi:MAG: ribonuclease E/G, partial [Brachymonas sp.]|nr:ribonuclease E/G [Brachymonas sp.]
GERSRGERNGQRGRNGEGREGRQSREPRESREGRDGNRPPRGERSERGERNQEGRRSRDGERGEKQSPAREMAETDGDNNRRDNRRERGGRDRQRTSAPETAEATTLPVVAQADKRDDATAPMTDTAPLSQGETAFENAGQGSESGDNRERRERRSRDRYGRDRRNRDRQPATASNDEDGQATSGSAFAQPAASHEDTAEPVAGRSYFSPQANAPVPDLLGTVPAEPEVASTVQVSMPDVAAKEVEQAARPAAMPVVQAYALPDAQLQQIAASAGLQWVHTDADRLSVVREAIAAEPQAVHVPRERPPAVQLDDGPLILVETRKDLRELVLPFDTPENAA